MDIEKESKVSRFIAGEDVARGDYITITRVRYELVPCFCEVDTTHDAMRINVTPDIAGLPLKVKGVCLPFVLVKSPRGRHATLDLRRHTVARLARDYGRAAFRRLKADAKAKRKRK